MSMLIAMALAMAGPTKEEAKLLRPVKDTPTVQLDPNGAYILLRSPAPVPINLFRIATPEELDEYRARRAEVLAKSHAKWVKAHANWAREYKWWKEDPQSYRKPDEEPVEPTDANLDFPALDKENLIDFGPLFRFAKQKGGDSTYLQRVWPGRYVVYGSVIVNPEGGGTGMCVCMGTIAFDAKAGEITDVGAVKVSMADALTWPGMLDKAEPEEVEALRTGAMTMMRWTLPNASLPVDPRLGAYKVVPASFKPAGPVPNYYGVQVDRMTAIPGVLGYERDKIVDLSAEAAASAAP
jgi:hypothetical protein